MMKDDLEIEEKHVSEDGLFGMVPFVCFFSSKHDNN